MRDSASDMIRRFAQKHDHGVASRKGLLKRAQGGLQKADYRDAEQVEGVEARRCSTMGWRFWNTHDARPWVPAARL